nr:hypothetical protein [Streptomyces sp. CB01635]
MLPDRQATTRPQSTKSPKRPTWPAVPSSTTSSARKPIAEWGEQRRELLRQGLRAEGLEHPDGKDTRHALSRCMSILAGISQENPAQTKAVLTAWVRAGFPLHEQPCVSGMFTEFIKAGQAWHGAGSRHRRHPAHGIPDARYLPRHALPVVTVPR